VVLRETQRKLEVEEDKMIFTLPDEGELLELPEIKEEFLKENELNQEIQPHKTTKNDAQENDALKVLPLTKRSSLASTICCYQGTIRFDLMHDKEVLKLELSCDDYIRVFNKLMGARTYCFEYRTRPTPKIFKNSYMFKQGGIEGTLQSSQPKYCSKVSRLSLGDKDFLYELLVDVGLELLGFEDKSSLRGEVLMHAIEG